MSDLLNVALNCAQKGWFIFPLEERKKTPNLALAPHWSEDSSNDPAKITEWWKASPNSNIGIDLNRSGLTVLDFDAGEAPPNIGLPETFTVTTGRGQHLYYKGRLAQGDMHFAGKHVGEVKSAGGYVVGPKSLHPSGAVYSVTNRADVAEAPAPIIAELRHGSPSSTKPIDASVNGDKIPHGQHDITLHRIAGKLRDIGLGEESIYTHLVAVCEERCDGYGSDYLEMCRKHAHNICKHPVGKNYTATVGSSSVQAVEPVNLDDWRKYFRSVGQLEDGDVRMIINDFWPEGINFIGALSGHGKTLVALSMVKSLTSGERFLGKYQPEDIIPCLYLIPESSSRAFKMRCRAFGITEDDTLFLCRTVSEGMTLLLDDPILKKAIEVMKPVVFLDTMVRFNQSSDENNSAANQKLAGDIIALRAAGAVAVVGLHHSTKASANEEMTLENCLRGTGDIAALCDSVYAIRRDRILYDDGNGPNEIDVKCVKPRDIKNPPKPFRIAATYKKEDGRIVSHIDESGDFFLVEYAAVQQELESKFLKMVIRDPSIPRAELCAELGITEHACRRLAKKLGWSRPSTKNGTWAMGKKTVEPRDEVGPNVNKAA